MVYPSGLFLIQTKILAPWVPIKKDIFPEGISLKVSLESLSWEFFYTAFSQSKNTTP